MAYICAYTISFTHNIIKTSADKIPKGKLNTVLCRNLETTIGEFAAYVLHIKHVPSTNDSHRTGSSHMAYGSAHTTYSSVFYFDREIEKSISSPATGVPSPVLGQPCQKHLQMCRADNSDQIAKKMLHTA